MASDFLSQISSLNKNPYLLKLLEEGNRPTIGHWQGANKALNAVLAGVEMGMQDKKDRLAGESLASLPGLEDEAPAPSASTNPYAPNAPAAAAAAAELTTPKGVTPGPVAPALAFAGQPDQGGYMPDDGQMYGKGAKEAITRALGGPQEANKVPSSSRVMGDDEGVAKGYYDPPQGGAARPPNMPGTVPVRTMSYRQGEGGPDLPFQVAQATGAPGRPPAGAPRDLRSQPQMAPIQHVPGSIPAELRPKIRDMLRHPNPIIKQQGLNLYNQYRKPVDEPQPLSPQDAQRFGLPNGGAGFYRQGGSIKKIDPTLVNIDQKGESALTVKSAELDAKRYGEIIDDVPASRQMLNDLDTLRDLGTRFQTGKVAEIKSALGPYAEALGVKIDNLGDIQAYEAIVNRVAPNLRVKGSGAQSDMELRNFLKSLPSIGNTPEGNAMIQRTMEGLYQNKIAAAELADRAANKEITRGEFIKAIRDLPDPLKEWRELQKKGGGGKTDSGGPDKPKLKYDPATGVWK